MYIAFENCHNPSAWVETHEGTLFQGSYVAEIHFPGQHPFGLESAMTRGGPCYGYAHIQDGAGGLKRVRLPLKEKGRLLCKQALLSFDALGFPNKEHLP